MDDGANNKEEKVKDDITGQCEAEIKEEGHSMNEDKTRTIVYKLTQLLKLEKQLVLMKKLNL